MYESIHLVTIEPPGVVNSYGNYDLTTEETAAELADQTILSTEPIRGYGDYDTLIQCADERGEIRWYLAVV